MADLAKEEKSPSRPESPESRNELSQSTTTGSLLGAQAAPVLQPRHIFGLKADVNSNIHYLEDHTVLYPVGHNVVLYNTETKVQRFIHGTDASGQFGKTEIIALAVSPNKRYVAISERASPEKGGADKESNARALITIYDTRTLKKRKALTTVDCMSKEFVSICFSPDNKSLLSLGGAPDWVLINWHWQRSKPLNSVHVESKGLPLYQCSYCPSDPSLLCVSGKSTLRYYKIEEGSNTLKLVETSGLERRDEEDYLCHAWTNGKRMVVGTDKGHLLLLENTIFREELRSSPVGKSIDSIVAYPRGFVIGCDGGVVRTYERHDTEHYALNWMFTIEGHSSRVKSVVVSPSEDDLAVTTESSQIFLLRSFHDDVKEKDLKFEPLTGVLFHDGGITGMDVCVRKPIVVTCGLDKTVRVWNYLTKQIEISLPFAETPWSIALHPSGLHALIGFQDKLRLMNILMDDIRVSKEFPIKQCMECRFSHGGQYFAAVHSGLIQIYSTYTCEIVATFRGHTGVVKSLYWSLDDMSIVSAGQDGAVYEKRLNQANRHQEYVQKGIRFSSALVAEDSGKIYAVGDDGVLKEIFDRNVVNKESPGVVLTQMAISHPPQRMLFCGTANGSILSYAFPLTGAKKEIVCHAKPVSRMRITFDDAYLFSISDDGALAMFTVKEREGRIAKRDRPDSVPFAEEVLVTKTDLEEKTSMMAELQAKVAELTTHNDYQLRVRDNLYHEKLKEVTEQYNSSLEADKSKIDMLREEKQDLEMEYDEKMTKMKTEHANRLHGEDLENQKMIMKEVTKYQRLQELMDEEEREFERQMRERELRHQRELMDQREKYESELRSVRMEAKAVAEAKNMIWREYTETKAQLEDDTDREIEDLKQKYDGKLNSEKDQTLRLKGENGIMLKKFTALQKDIEDQKENIRAMVDKAAQLEEEINKREAKITMLKEEIEERDKTIGEKEKQIYDLKKDNQELEKFKFVRDYEIKELKRQTEPRENEIAAKKERVAAMDAELEAYHKQNARYSQEVETLKEVLKQKQNEIQLSRQTLRQSEADLAFLANDLHELVQFIQDPQKLKEGLEGIYRKHVTEKIQAVEVDPDVSKEYKRQKGYLEKSVDVLKAKLARDLKARKNDNMRIMQENVSLIKEINKMRREIKMMHQVQRQKELSSVQNPGGASVIVESDWDEKETQKLLEMQREQIAMLRRRIDEAQSRVARHRPVSRERLAPVDEFSLRRP